MSTIEALWESFPEGSTLRDCGPAGLQALADVWTSANYTPRTLIVSADDTDDDVFFVLTGRARAATYTDNGREILLSDMLPGWSFGELAAIDPRPRSTNVLAVEPSRIARMSAAQFNEVLRTNADVMMAFMSFLVRRIRDLSERMTDVTTLNAEQRLCNELMRLARNQMTGPDTAVVDPIPTQQELATLIFSQRESVGRDMSKLKDMGIIERQGRKLMIHSLARLARRLPER